MPRTMSDKQKRAINRGRVKAGLKPIKWGNKMTRKQTDREAFKRAGLKPINFVSKKKAYRKKI